MELIAFRESVTVDKWLLCHRTGPNRNDHALSFSRQSETRSVKMKERKTVTIHVGHLFDHCRPDRCLPSVAAVANDEGRIRAGSHRREKIMFRAIAVLLVAAVLVGNMSGMALAGGNDCPYMPIDNELPDRDYDGFCECPELMPAIGWQWALVLVYTVDIIDGPNIVDRNGDGYICEPVPEGTGLRSD
jgi:hypothetical protein